MQLIGMLPIFCRGLPDGFAKALAEIAGAFKTAQVADFFDGIGAVFQKTLGLGDPYTPQILHDRDASLRLIGAA